MSDPEEQEMPHVSTESQRQALDEMSRQLVEKLNDMVREQHERARRFAATQHSLSPLPELTPLPQETPLAHPTSAIPESAPPQKKQRPLPPRPTARKEPEKFDIGALRDTILPRNSGGKQDDPSAKKEEAGCGSGTIITLIIIIIIIIRSCS